MYAAGTLVLLRRYSAELVKMPIKCPAIISDIFRIISQSFNYFIFMYILNIKFRGMYIYTYIYCSDDCTLCIDILLMLNLLVTC